MSYGEDYGKFYNRQGERITLEEWGRTRNYDSDIDERRVAMDTLDDGRWISTVWLGMDHRFGEGPPLIFETMVFPPGDMGDLYCERYSTEAEAIAGHDQIVARAKAGEWMSY